MRVAVVVFPGSGGAADATHAFGEVLGQQVETVWYQEESVGDADILVVPGGAAFGDYLRPGALARGTNIVGSIIKFARDRKPVIGIGNGFQILCELEILPGILLPNTSARYLNTETFVRVETIDSPWSAHLETEDIIELPISCYAGRYYADKRTLKDLEEEGRVVFRYCDAEGDIDPDDCFNGSANGIAGIVNRHRNVLGIMPHPERAVDSFLGAAEGRAILESVLLGERLVEVDEDDDDDDDD